MDRSEDKTVVRVPVSDTEHGNWLTQGYVLQGRYIIDAELGAGGFGITYLAKHRYLEDIWVAIKEYLPDGAATRDSGSRVHVISDRYNKMYSWGLHRFLDEARLLRQFNHANIVSVQDFFEANNTAYLVMNYVRGRSLQTELDSGRVFDEKKLRAIIYPLLDALQCIHREGLFHRDISPDNILLQEKDDTPVLIDFGSARYAMRMHGPEQVNGGQGHTPTAIFKQGYSPIEQYEGSDQGPFTDIYALGATLYRAALGTRPVDALKRSGELRLKKPDPLEPATEKGRGKFSKEFLTAIDAALQLEANERPQTIEEWLKIFGKPAETEPSGPAPTVTSSRKGLKALITGVLVLTLVGLAGFFASQYLDPTEEDIPSLLSEAGERLGKGAFSEQRLAEARALYLQVLTLDHENRRGMSGYSATNLLSQFSDAIESEEPGKAAVLLDRAERELEQTGIDVGVLVPGQESLKLLNSRLALRSAIRRQPLSPDSWPDISLLLDEMAALEGGKPLAESGRQGLKAIQASYSAVQKNDYETARDQIKQAEQQLSPLGVKELASARSEIESRQRQWQAERDLEIETLLSQAEEYLNQAPLTAQSLDQARTTYQGVRTLDPEQPRARIGIAVSQHLAEALGRTQENDFTAAQKALAQAQRAVGNSNLWNSALDQTKQQLGEARKTWNLSQTRTSARALLVQAAEDLLSDPLNPATLSGAGELFQETLALSQGGSELDAEAAAALAGSKLVLVLENIRKQLDGQEFGAARSRLKEEETRSLSYRIGLGEPFLVRTEQAIALTEADWNLTQAAILLREDLLAAEVQAQAAQHLQRVLALQPDHSSGTQALAAMDSLRAVAGQRQAHDYPGARDNLRQAQAGLAGLAIAAEVFAAADGVIQEEEAAWTTRQRNQEIATRLAEASDLFQRYPFDPAAWERAKTLFGEISQIEGGAEQAAAGQSLISALQGASAAMATGRFDDAQSRINEAEQIAAAFGIERLDQARELTDEANRKWEQEKQRKIAANISDAEQLLVANPPTPEILQQARQAYQAALELESDQVQAQAGLIIISSLESFLRALQEEEFDRAREHLANAESKVTAARLNPNLLEGAKRRLTTDRDSWNLDQTRQQILALRQRVAEQLSRQPISEEHLAGAEKTLQEAAVLSQSHPGLEAYSLQSTAGLEAVILLRAFLGELEQAQFDNARKTLSDVDALLAEAELDPAIRQHANEFAVSSEIDWRLSDSVRALSRDLDILISDVGLETAETNYTIIAKLNPDHPGIESALLGVASLRQITAARARHDYDQAKSLLDRATGELAGVGVADTAFDAVRQRLAQEQSLWQNLSQERNLNRWAGEAIGRLNRSPFLDTAWREVESLAQQILDTRPDDHRGLAVTGALDKLRRAKAAMDASEFAEARRQVEKAQSELAAIGIYNSLDSALQKLDRATQETVQAGLQRANDALAETPSSNSAQSDARSALERVLAVHPGHPVAQAGIATINLLRQADAAMTATEYARSAKLLAEAEQQLRTVETREPPLPQLRKALADSRRKLAKQRPGPGEIYPLISVALGAIARDPLGSDSLGTADKLLSNVLAMQVDEPTALAGQKAVEQLRIAAGAIAAGADQNAAAALKQAEKLLTSIGLSPSVLAPAWQALD